MTIGIDGNEANGLERVGIGEYSFELLRQFKEFPIYNVQFQIYLKNKPVADLPVESKNWQYAVFGPKKLWTQFALPLRLFTTRNKPDVFFTPSHYAPRFSSVPTVVSIMDLAFVHFPNLFRKSDLYQLQNWTKYSVKNASRILTISKSSADDIIKTYRIPPAKVMVTYLGVKPAVSLEPHIYLMDDLRKRFGIAKSYILFVGTLQPRKNIERLIQSYSKLQQSKDVPPPVQLLVVGKKGWLYDQILSAPLKYNVEKSVLFLDFVTDDELGVLYKNATFFILPSLYEGFGLPVLEAMKQGCPVITSKVSSLPEAGGDAALYVDPESVEDITKKMKQLLTDEKLQELLRKKGYEQVAKFSWEKTAKQTLEVLMEVGEGK